MICRWVWLWQTWLTQIWQQHGTGQRAGRQCPATSAPALALPLTQRMLIGSAFPSHDPGVLVCKKEIKPISQGDYEKHSNMEKCFIDGKVILEWILLSAPWWLFKWQGYYPCHWLLSEVALSNCWVMQKYLQATSVAKKDLLLLWLRLSQIRNVDLHFENRSQIKEGEVEKCVVWRAVDQVWGLMDQVRREGMGV